MKIQIDIPKEFEKEFKEDRFYSTLMRLKSDAYCLSGNYEMETIDMLINAFHNSYCCDAIPIKYIEDLMQGMYSQINVRNIEGEYDLQIALDTMSRYNALKWLIRYWRKENEQTNETN